MYVYIHIYVYTSIHIHVFIYTYVLRIRNDSKGLAEDAANLRTKILDFRGFGSSVVLSLRGGVLMSIGNFPESLSQQILVAMLLVGRLGVSSLFARMCALCRPGTYNNSLRSFSLPIFSLLMQGGEDLSSKV